MSDLMRKPDFQELSDYMAKVDHVAGDLADLVTSMRDHLFRIQSRPISEFDMVKNRDEMIELAVKREALLDAQAMELARLREELVEERDRVEKYWNYIQMRMKSDHPMP
jgi:hypothetical protein